MSRKRILLVGLPRAAGVAAARTLLLGLSGVLACSTYPTYKDLPTDCTAENGYEFYDNTTPSELTPLDRDNFKYWFAAADYTPDAGVGAAVSANYDATTSYVASAQVNPVALNPADGSVCGNTNAVVFRASHNNDWGCLFGNYDFGNNHLENASGWEGIAFWARAPGGTTKGFTLAFSDENSASASASGSGTIASYCRNYVGDGGVSTQTGGGPNGIDPSTGTPLSGSGTTRAPYPDECGNGYNVARQVTTDWRFYPVPFSDFKQTSNPNRVPTGLLTSGLRNFVIRMQKAAEVELWLTKLAFYSKNAHADAGTDAPEM